MIALDTNILIYAEQRGEPSGKGDIAADLIGRLTLADVVVPVQVFGEFLGPNPSGDRTKLRNPHRVAVIPRFRARLG